jgi:hypothetical protein
MFASAETQAAWQISNLARGRDNAVPPFRIRSGWNKCDHSRPGERRFPRFREPQADCFSICPRRSRRPDLSWVGALREGEDMLAEVVDVRHVGRSGLEAGELGFRDDPSQVCADIARPHGGHDFDKGQLDA